MPESALVEIDITGNGCAGNAVFLLGFYWLQSLLNKYKPFMRVFSFQIYMILLSINYWMILDTNFQKRGNKNEKKKG